MEKCPYCQQDDLWIVEIEGLIEPVVVICTECDTVWSNDEPINDGTGKNFDEFMKMRGKEASWKLVRRKEKIVG